MLVKLNPFISETVWGGDKLKSLKNLNNKNPVGETWEVSTLENGSSLVGDKKLSDLCALKYLVKFIDTKKHLSVQVHPDDEYAKVHENSSGKTECWLILDAKPGAGIYLGFKEGVTKKEFFNAVKNSLPVDKFLNFYPAKTGDYFMIPSGAIHAIGADVTLIEIQQSSGVTYRVWDWDRLGLDGKPRELHIEKASDVLNFSKNFQEELIRAQKSGLLDESSVQILAKHNDFNVQLFSLIPSKKTSIQLKEKDAFILLEGEVKFENTTIKAYETYFCLQEREIEFEIINTASFIIVSEPK